jgi:predicted transcriptional regulator
MVGEGRGDAMTLKQLSDILETRVLWGDDYLDGDITTVYASDLMSDVLTSTRSGAVLITKLTNPQVVRTAEMAEIAAICFVSGKVVQDETIRLAREKRIPLLSTRLSMYESCGRLYKKELPSGDNFK